MCRVVPESFQCIAETWKTPWMLEYFITAMFHERKKIDKARKKSTTNLQVDFKRGIDSYSVAAFKSANSKWLRAFSSLLDVRVIFFYGAPHAWCRGARWFHLPCCGNMSTRWFYFIHTPRTFSNFFVIPSLGKFRSLRWGSAWVCCLSRCCSNRSSFITMDMIKNWLFACSFALASMCQWIFYAVPLRHEMW